MRLWLQFFSLILYLTTSKSSISTFTDQLISIFQPKISVRDAHPNLVEPNEESLRIKDREFGKTVDDKKEWGSKEEVDGKKWEDRDETEKGGKDSQVEKPWDSKIFDDKGNSKVDDGNHWRDKDGNDEKPIGDKIRPWYDNGLDNERGRVEKNDNEKPLGSKDDEKQLDSRSLDDVRQKDSQFSLDVFKKWGSKFLHNAKLWSKKRAFPMYDRRNGGNNMFFRSADAQVEQQPPELKMDRNSFHLDPVLNMIQRRSQQNYDSDDLSSESSSQELPKWKDEFQQLWMHKKFEALNQTVPGGDNVNMLAARPWGVPCGDPNQHDMPWGSCMLPMECEPEFRVYRGDMFCGRTRFVCCAILLTTYDMYQGFDVSFDQESISTDSEERRERERTSKEKRKIKHKREKRKRQKDRNRRKKKMQKNIKKIIKEIRKILNKQYSNGTHERKKKTKQLKKFIKTLKKEYRKDRESLKDVYEKELILVDQTLNDKLKKMKFMNQDFINNATFREIVVNGSISKKGARMLLDTYPELASYLETRRWRAPLPPESQLSSEYDLEYGYLYS